MSYRNWILFNFHFHQMLLKVNRENARSCVPIEKWEPRGEKQKEEIANRKAMLKQVSILDEVADNL